MKKIYKIFIVALLLFGVLRTYLYKNNAAAGTRVVFSYGQDGDSCVVKEVDEEYTIRMIGINAPEKGEAYGDDAKKFVNNKMKNAKEIILESDPNADFEDKYGRHLVWVFVDGELLQKEIVEKGLARVAYLYDDYLYTDELFKAEDYAKANKLGIWNE